MKRQPSLFEQVVQYKDYLSVQGIPQIDYIINFEKRENEDIINIIKNFEKSLLWRQGKFEDLINFEQLYKEKMDYFCSLNDIKLLTMTSKL